MGTFFVLFLMALASFGLIWSVLEARANNRDTWQQLARVHAELRGIRSALRVTLASRLTAQRLQAELRRTDPFRRPTAHEGSEMWWQW